MSFIVHERSRLALALALTALLLTTAAAKAHADIVADLEGAWKVAQASMNGVARADGKVLNATWTFRGTELLVQAANGERLRAALSFEASAVPPAFHVSPVDPSTDRPLWIIWARQGDELRVAFYDGVDRRPEDFGPRPKLVVLTLVASRAVPAPVASDPCGILRAAGVDGLLGGATRARPTQRGGSTLGTAYVSVARQEAQAKPRMQIEDELALGADAFSAASGWTLIVVAHRRGTAMILKLEALGADRTEVRRFAARVLDAL